MVTERAYHSAVVLGTGDVLVVGGLRTGGVDLSSPELYDPTTNVDPGGSMATARHRQTATLMGNGTVLVAGGTNGSTALASAEAYDPRTGFSMVAGVSPGAAAVGKSVQITGSEFWGTLGVVRRHVRDLLRRDRRRPHGQGAERRAHRADRSADPVSPRLESCRLRGQADTEELQPVVGTSWNDRDAHRNRVHRRDQGAPGEEEDDLRREFVHQDHGDHPGGREHGRIVCRDAGREGERARRTSRSREEGRRSGSRVANGAKHLHEPRLIDGVIGILGGEGKARSVTRPDRHGEVP